MIDEKKLLCVFIYSAYTSGFCKHGLSTENKKRHMDLYRKYISNGGDYPLEEIEATHKEMTERVKKTGVREYIYGDHIERVVSDIEIRQSPFETAVKGAFYGSAVSCPSNFYSVTSVPSGGRTVIGKNIILGTLGRLEILEGLEIPQPGNIISGHLNHFLEIVDGLRDRENYIERLREYFERIRNAREN